MHRNQELKQEEEWQLLRYFRRAWPEFPHARVVKSESPDFILHLSRHRMIGLELTRLFLRKATDELHFVPQLDSERASLVALVRDAYHKAGGMPIHVHFEFDPHQEPDTTHPLLFSTEIVEFLCNRMKKRKAGRYFRTKFRQRDLPDRLRSASVIHHPEDRLTEMVVCAGMVPAENYLESIQMAIDQKQEKMALYQKNRFDEYWLLIAADCLDCATPYNMIKLLEQWEFASGFHRIFLFEIYEGNVYELGA